MQRQVNGNRPVCKDSVMPQERFASNKIIMTNTEYRASKRPAQTHTQFLLTACLPKPQGVPEQNAEEKIRHLWGRKQYGTGECVMTSSLVSGEVQIKTNCTRVPQDAYCESLTVSVPRAARKRILSCPWAYLDLPVSVPWTVRERTLSYPWAYLDLPLSCP